MYAKQKWEEEERCLKMEIRVSTDKTIEKNEENLLKELDKLEDFEYRESYSKITLSKPRSIFKETFLGFDDLGYFYTYEDYVFFELYHLKDKEIIQELLEKIEKEINLKIIMEIPAEGHINPLPKGRGLSNDERTRKDETTES